MNHTPHVNRNPTSFVTSRFAAKFQQASHLATTLDSTKHTVVFCSPQTLPPEDGRDLDIEHRARQGTDPHHTSDPPDAQNMNDAITVGKAFTHPEQSRNGANEAEMSEEEESMVQETYMELMAGLMVSTTKVPLNHY